MFVVRWVNVLINFVLCFVEQNESQRVYRPVNLDLRWNDRCKPLLTLATSTSMKLYYWQENTSPLVFAIVILSCGSSVANSQKTKIQHRENMLILVKRFTRKVTGHYQTNVTNYIKWLLIRRSAEVSSLALVQQVQTFYELHLLAETRLKLYDLNDPDLVDIT